EQVTSPDGEVTSSDEEDAPGGAENARGGTEEAFDPTAGVQETAGDAVESSAGRRGADKDRPSAADIEPRTDESSRDE
ncbi:MAG: hypothetical protein L0G69_07975, partial [Brevibacterium sp.]|nr:hypothetical protein [Brevibacterium sp.]